VLTLVFRSLRFIPFKSRTTVFEEPVIESYDTILYLQCKYTQ